MRADTRQDYEQRLQRVVNHIYANLDDALDLEELADVACFSPYHFHRVFRGMVGESVMACVRRLRLERAALKLKTTDLPITRIAFEAGYEAHESFVRAFRSEFDMTPSEFRQRKPGVLSAAPSGVHYGPDGPGELSPVFPGGEIMDVRAETVEPMRVAYVRHTGPYNEVGEAFGMLNAWAGPKGLYMPNTKVIGLYYDDPDVTPAGELRADLCITVPDDIEGEGHVQIQTIGGGDYAVAMHKGPFDTISQTYAEMMGQWAPAAGRQFREGPTMELYLSEPSTPPEENLVEVYVPIEAA